MRDRGFLIAILFFSSAGVVHGFFSGSFGELIWATSTAAFVFGRLMDT